MLHLIERLRKQLIELDQWRDRVACRVETMRHAPQWEDGMEDADFDDSQWETMPAGGPWGERLSEDAFRFELPPAPEPEAGWEQFLVFGPGPKAGFTHPEALIFIDGKPLAAVDREHHLVAVEDLLDPTAPHQIALKAFSGHDPRPKTFDHIGIVERHTTLDRLYWDARVLYDTALSNSEDSPERASILRLLGDTLLRIDRRQPMSPAFFDSVAIASEYLVQASRSFEWDWPARPRMTAVGHGHMDTAWHWRIRHTRQKLERNVTHMLYLMDRYPEYTYIQSQAVQYQMIKEDRPDLFERIKEKVKEGQWNANGALWVEPDTNVPSGESLVRQVMYGTRFFEEELGVKRHILWLVDTFGYTAAFPQILRGFGVDYMTTTKLSWNDTNRFPYDTFRWVGLDGSEVLVDLITCPNTYPRDADKNWRQTYNGKGTVDQIVGTWGEYRHKEVSRDRFIAQGYGDGGGGATLEMIEMARRLGRMPNVPAVEWGLIEDHADRMLSRRDEFPVYDGELYLEFHRGTYTSQAMVKRNNRKTEALLHDAEFLGAWAKTLGSDYDANAVRKVWDCLLINQFHDILPGSSITEVYRDSEEQFDEARATMAPVIDGALDTIAVSLPAQGDGVAVFNTLSFARGGVHEIEIETNRSGALVDCNGIVRATQQVGDGETGRLLVDLPMIAAYGAGTLTQNRDATVTSCSRDLTIAAQAAENAFLRVELNDAGEIVSLFDKEAGREIVPEGAALNRLTLFEDRPLHFDAWDIDDYYKLKSWTVDQLDSSRIIEEGPLRVGWEIKRSFLDSTITQRVYLRHDSRRLDFVTEVDWHECKLMLKADFPLGLRAREANCEIQFGHLPRPMTANDSIEAAKFEVCAHKWVDVSEDDYGLAVLNDCKYGYDVQNGGIRLSLLRSPTVPDPVADLGRHEFTYSLLPHVGRLSEGDVVNEGFDLNQPLMSRTIAGNDINGARRKGLFSIEPSNVVIDTVKPAEDGDGIVLRLYESARRTSKARVVIGIPASSACLCDMKETDGASLAAIDGVIEFDIKPFEVKTVRVRTQ